MASFDNRTAYSYAQAEVVQVLKPYGSLLCRRRSTDIYQKLIRIENDDDKSGQESWKVAFAPDETYFAWSCGNQYVVLVSLNSLISGNKESKKSFNGLDIQEYKVLDCCSHVFSVAFGSTSCSRRFEKKQNSWNLHKFNKDLVLAVGLQNGRIRLWDVHSGRLLLKLMDHTGLVNEVSFAPDGSMHLASASFDSTVKIWNLKDDGNMFKTFKGQSKMFSCCWSPDAKKLVCVGKSRVGCVWNMLTYEIIFKLNGHLNSISCCKFSPDGSIIATASYDTQVILWDSHTGNIVKKLGHLFPQPSMIFASGENGTYVRSVSFSSDGSHIASVCDDGYLRFWNLCEYENENPVEITSINRPLCCSFAPSGQVIAVGNSSGIVSMILAPMKVSSLRYISRMAVRNLIIGETIDLEELYKILPRHFVNKIIQ